MYGRLNILGISQFHIIYTGTEISARAVAEARMEMAISLRVNDGLGWNSGLEVVGTGTESRVGIGITSPNASAKLQIDSTTKGFLPPRMTTTQKNAIASPAAGLVLYDSTTNKLQCYNGSTWNDLF